MNSRRDFLKGTAWMGVTALAAGCMGPGFDLGAGGRMHGFKLNPMKRVRVGFIGLGARGGWAVQRITKVPGVDIAAICDKKDERIAETLKFLRENGVAEPKVFRGEEGWKALCEMDGLDAVYICTPWALHAPMGLRAMRNGKVTFLEVPAAMTLDECWELVETSEKTKVPCMQLENCCYGEIELLEFNVARLGLLGELVHGEGGYIHDLRGVTQLSDTANGSECEWRYGENVAHKGNRYPTHGLVPLCLTFDINRGDRFDYLVSLESNQANHEWYKKNLLKEGDPRLADRIEMGDMNVTLLKTVKGKSILIKHDVSTPRPYSRIQYISGTKGAMSDYPFRVAIEEKVGAFCHEWWPEEKADAFRQQHMHPLWKSAGPIAQKVGGHGGMDYIMDLRWAYCLQNGLPLDMDVYDLATSCSLCELTEKSVRNRSRSYDVPDFTCGGWKTAPQHPVVDIDITKLDLSGVGAVGKPMDV